MFSIIELSNTLCHISVCYGSNWVLFCYLWYLFFKMPPISYPGATDTVEDDIEQIALNGKDQSSRDGAATIYG